MADVDWRSEEAYANFKNAESMDIAWEWLRRDADYQKRLSDALSDAQQLSGATETFDSNGGSLFAADPQKAFDKQPIFWAPRPYRPSCRSVRHPPSVGASNIIST